MKAYSDLNQFLSNVPPCPAFYKKMNIHEDMANHMFIYSTE